MGLLLLVVECMRVVVIGDLLVLIVIFGIVRVFLLHHFLNLVAQLH